MTILDAIQAKIEVLVQPETSARLLEALERDYFPRYAMIAFESEVRVLRGHKF